MTNHTAGAFDTDLRDLSNKIEKMGRLDEQQIKDAIAALVARDVVLAKQVVASDDQVDALQREIEEKAVVTIARRQPMAIDLREIVGALRISNELERIGDRAENIAKRVLLLTDGIRINEVMPQLQHMAQLVVDQLDMVLRSYKERDVALALTVWNKDRDVDAIDNALFRQLLTYMMEDPRNITFCTHLLFCAKNLERIGDHATNVAETVYYMVQGHPILEERPKADITSRETLSLSA
jgi:phosphate transport system protein